MHKVGTGIQSAFRLRCKPLLTSYLPSFIWINHLTLTGLSVSSFKMRIKVSIAQDSSEDQKGKYS